MSGTLFIVATPIGNLGDITARAVETLGKVSVILCEDTRVSRKLATAIGITTPLSPYHDHNAAKVRPGLLARLTAGEEMALISDAGTPLLSDPGYKLVREAVEAGISVTALPGASALLAALCVAGLPTDGVYFGGFLPTKSGAIETALAPLTALPATLVFYETPKRLPKSLPVLARVLGDGRDAAVCRELTKLHETVYRGTLADLAELAATDGIDERGEAVVLIGPPGEAAPPSETDLDAALQAALDRGLSVKDAAADVAKATGVSKRDLYQRALAL